MTPATIIMQAKQDGVILALSESGNVKATGDQGAIARWMETIRENKPGIIATLRGADPHEPANDREFTDDRHPDASLPMPDELMQSAASVNADLPEPVSAENAYPECNEEECHIAWRYYFADQEPETGVFMTPVNHQRALEINPSAIAAVPLHLTDGVSCKTCLHLRGGGWPAPSFCAGRDDLPPAFGINHPLRDLPEDGGVKCGAYRHISEKGKK